MFKNKTVFILGAGASWHYGYPTGAQLVNSVSKRAREAGNLFRATADTNLLNAIEPRPIYVHRGMERVGSFQDMMGQWRAAAGHCNELVDRLESLRPLVIDYFLGHNPSIQEIGKLMVAWTILECEARYHSLGYNPNREKRGYDDWCRFIIHKLVSDCRESKALLDNNVTFITFNYDVSLETRLYEALSDYELFQQEHVHEFFSAHRVLHVYGKIRENPYAPFTTIPIGLLPFSPTEHANDPRRLAEFYTALNQAMNTAFAASQQMRTIGPAEKHEEVDVIERARAALAEAKCIYVLGYGFDDNNNALLQLGQHLRLGGANCRAVLFTNYGNLRRLNRKIGTLLFGDNDILTRQNPVQNSHPRWFWEESEQDVYDAFEHDFDDVEAQNLFPG